MLTAWSLVTAWSYHDNYICSSSSFGATCTISIASKLDGPVHLERPLIQKKTPFHTRRYKGVGVSLNYFYEEVRDQKNVVLILGTRTTKQQTTIKDLPNDILYDVLKRLDTPDRTCLALSSRRFYQTMMATASPTPLARIRDLYWRLPLVFAYLSDSYDYAVLKSRFVLYLSREQVVAALSCGGGYPDCTCYSKREQHCHMIFCECSNYDMLLDNFECSFDRQYDRAVRQVEQRMEALKGKHLFKRLIVSLVVWSLVWLLMSLYIGHF